MTELSPGSSLSQTYSVQGMSIKLATNNSESAPISQFEYTYASDKIFYDLSNINGYPFAAWGMIVVPSMESDAYFPTCLPIVCPAGSSVCSAAYNEPNANRTMVCDQNASISLTLCPNVSNRE